MVADGRRRRLGIACGLSLEVCRGSGDDILGCRRGVFLRGREVGMTEDPLNVGQRHIGVVRHSVGRSMAQGMQGPLGIKSCVDSLEHSVRRMVCQPGVGPAADPPQRLLASPGHQTMQLVLIQPQPYERVRRRRDLLSSPAAFSHHRDQLLTRIDIALIHPDQLRCSRSGRHEERHQGTVAVTRQLGEQLIERLVGYAARHPGGR